MIENVANRKRKRVHGSLILCEDLNFHTLFVTHPPPHKTSPTINLISSKKRIVQTVSARRALTIKDIYLLNLFQKTPSMCSAKSIATLDFHSNWQFSIVDCVCIFNDARCTWIDRLDAESALLIMITESAE